MSNLIVLTVTSQAGRPVSSVSMLFDVSKMSAVQDISGHATFSYPNGISAYPNGESALVPFTVAENLAAIVAAVGAASTATQAKQVARLKFDATGGKTAAAYNLVDAATGAPVTFPIGTRITRAWYEVTTTFTSAGSDAGTISLGVPTDDAAGIVAAIAISDVSNPWDAGLHEGIQTGTATNFGEKFTAARSIVATVATQSLTAGVLQLVVEYTVIS